jgi:uncharacterized protein YceH (UPF0502 family)
MELTAVEIRVLGCLVEKEATTPDNYPLSTNALITACNQSTNRDPVVAYDERTVDAAIFELRANKGLTRTITGGRTNKHRHVLAEAWELGPGELAVLAILMLRGPQTAGELRSRTERLHAFADLAGVEETLRTLAARAEPMVRELERRPGQKETRWEHLLGGHEAAGDGVRTDAARSDAVATPPATRVREADLRDLQEQVERLRVDVDRLYALLGEQPA